MHEPFTYGPNYNHLVNTFAPLNTRLKVWLLNLSGLTGGTTWFNLAKFPAKTTGAPLWNGALTNFAAPQTSASGFNPSTRPNGFRDLVFDSSGSADFVNLGDVFSGTGLVAGQGNFTVAMWVNIITVVANATLLGQGNSGHDFDLLMNGSGTLSFFINAGGHHIDTTTALAAGTWYHVGYTYAETGVVSTSEVNALAAYVNGRQEATGGDGSWRHTSAIDCYLAGTPSYARPANVRMDDVRLYDRCLSAGEMFQLYKESAFGYQHVLNYSQNSVLQYAIGQGSGSTIKFRRTLSPFGARVGSRQTQGM